MVRRMTKLAISLRRSVLLAFAAMCFGIPFIAQAQAISSAEYPTRPIRLLVPSPPGGSNDSVARIVSNGLSRSLGRTIVVDNRAGGGGIIASELVARAVPDGYTLLFAYAAFTTTPFLAANLSYDVLRDFSPITEIANQPLLLAINTAVPANTVKELIALSKSKPGGITAGYTQVGSATHLATEIFKLKTDTTRSIVSVSYKGGAAGQLALLSGEVQASFATATSSMPQIKTGRIRVLATSAAKRLPYLPDVPTFEEAGVSGVDVVVWQGLLAPVRTPRPIINRVHADVVKLLKLRETQERLAALGSDPVGSSPEEFAAKLKRELQEFGKIIKALGLKPQ
jgi:tripartite-type tricarboxylate transporter receptor subunit TctC